jgi:hypothetical protein
MTTASGTALSVNSRMCVIVRRRRCWFLVAGLSGTRWRVSALSGDENHSSPSRVHRQRRPRTIIRRRNLACPNGAFGLLTLYRQTNEGGISCAPSSPRWENDQLSRPIRPANSRTSAAYDGLARFTSVVTRLRAMWLR